MRLGAWHFTPGAWPSLACLLLLLLLMRLGFWQLERAEEKQTLRTDYLERGAAPPLRLEEAARKAPPAELYWRRFVLSGAYDPSRTYLLDNQVLGGEPGYRVFSRFVLEDGASLLAARGWTAAPGNRERPPAVAADSRPITVTGFLGPEPATGLRLADSAPEALGDNLVRVLHIDLERIAANNDWTLLPYVAYLDPPAPDGLSRQRPAPGFNREKHLGYAFQWFALATALLVVYVVVNTRREPGGDA